MISVARPRTGEEQQRRQQKQQQREADLRLLLAADTLEAMDIQQDFWPCRRRPRKQQA